MADEPEETAPAAEVDPRDERIARLEGKINDYERHLLDPAYLEYLGGRRNGGTAPAAERQPEPQEIDFDRMSNRDLAEYIINSVKGDVNQRIVPLQQDMAVKETLAQIKEAAGAHADYWDYKQQMIDLGKRHPTMTAEEVYQLAKAQSRPKPNKSAPRTEAPTGGASTERKPAAGFEPAFLKAWEAAGISKDRS